MNLELIQKLQKCCEREAALRKRVYPKFIISGKMTKATADEEIKLMQLAAACFEKIYKGNVPKNVQQSLFTTSNDVSENKS